MQYREVFIDGVQRFVFAFTKREAEVFRQATRNKKAPLDERIIHFIEGFARRREGFGYRLAHAYSLATLSRKYKSSAHKEPHRTGRMTGQGGTGVSPRENSIPPLRVVPRLFRAIGCPIGW